VEDAQSGNEVGQLEEFTLAEQVNHKRNQDERADQQHGWPWLLQPGGNDKANRYH